jgi:hypothetical protein
MRAFGSLVQLTCVALATEPQHRAPSSGWTADHVAPVRIALYCSGGASSCKTPTCCEPNVKYYATLYAAAKMAFGDAGFSIANLTAAEVVRLDASQHDVVVFPGGSGECPHSVRSATADLTCWLSNRRQRPSIRGRSGRSYCAAQICLRRQRLHRYLWWFFPWAAACWLLPAANACCVRKRFARRQATTTSLHAPHTRAIRPRRW